MDTAGFDVTGVDVAGFDVAGFDVTGFDVTGFDATGFDGRDFEGPDLLGALSSEGGAFVAGPNEEGRALEATRRGALGAGQAGCTAGAFGTGRAACGSLHAVGDAGWDPTWMVQPLAQARSNRAAAGNKRMLPPTRAARLIFLDEDRAHHLYRRWTAHRNFGLVPFATSPRSPPAGKGTPPTAVGGVALSPTRKADRRGRGFRWARAGRYLRGFAAKAAASFWRFA